MVIVAEDDVISRRIIGKALENIQQPVVYCSNGRLAWELLLDNPQVKLLITDMAMPEKDRRELIKAVRSHGEYKDLPIIIVSGVVTLKEIDDLLGLGASRFLPKPVDTAMLLDYVRYFCES